MTLLGETGNATTTGNTPAGSTGSVGSTAAGAGNTAAAPATNAPAAGNTGTALAGGKSEGTSSWRDSLPEDLKSNTTLSKFSDIANISKAYIELEKKIGVKGIIKPTATSSPEEWKSFREALGVPPLEKYDVSIPQGVEFPKESLEWAKKTGSEIGVLPEDMSKLMTEYAKFENERDDATAKEIEAVAKEQMDGLRKEWGDNFDTQIQRAHFAAKEIGGQDFIDYLNKTGMGNDVMLIKLMSKVSGLLGEDKLREGNVGSGRVSMEELDGQIKTIQAQLIALKPGDGRKAGLLHQWESLNKQRTGGK